MTTIPAIPPVLREIFTDTAPPANVTAPDEVLLSLLQLHETAGLAAASKTTWYTLDESGASDALKISVGVTGNAAVWFLVVGSPAMTADGTT